MIGFIMVGYGFYGLWAGRNPGNATGFGRYPMGPLMIIWWGSLALVFIFLLEVTSMTLFNQNSEVRSMLAYRTTTSNQSAEVIADALLAFTRAIGWWAFGKGLLHLLRRMRGDSQTNLGMAIVLLCFGSVCANILVFTDITAVSLGTQNFIRNFVP